jgi:hypothetical protein
MTTAPTADRAPDPEPSGGGRARARSGGPAGARSRRGRGVVALTGRGGIVVIYVTALLGALVAGWSGTDLLAGLAFVLGCAAAALLIRPTDLLTLAVSPPLVFFAATVTAVAVTNADEHSPVRSIMVGVLTALARTAPWLFAGTLLALALGVPRGMLVQVRELRKRLAGLRLFHEEENADPVRWDDTD